jgi:uncharacterized flavoprotein (TIGR03862 family)
MRSNENHLPLRRVAEITVIGAGPAGLMAAEVLARAGLAVTVFDRMASVGRKFLLAGRGGLNLTHSEPLERLLARYGAASPLLRDAILTFPPDTLRAWCDDLGQTTFVGSSGRVFPVALKASPLLRAWRQRLVGRGVDFRLRHRWTGFDDAGALIFIDADGDNVTVRPDATVLALGGASWPRLGSDASWVAIIRRAGISIVPLQPANCGFVAPWSDVFRTRFEGRPLKRIAVSFGTRVVRGEAMISRTGIEGGAIYGLAAQLRDAIAASGEAVAKIDLRPDTTMADLAMRLAVPRKKQSLSTFLRKAARLSPAAIGLLQEAAAPTAMRLPALIKAVPVRLIGTGPIERAISTAGGIAFDELDEHFMLRRMPGVFVAGEMLDWEAPTGGYLLQASFATGAAAGRGARDWLAARPQGQLRASPR